jgi:hypothetical protein
VSGIDENVEQRLLRKNGVFFRNSRCFSEMSGENQVSARWRYLVAL